MAIKYTHQDACQPLRERIAELEEELHESEQDMVDYIDSSETEYASLKEQVRVRGERMEQLWIPVQELGPVFSDEFTDWFDDNGEVIDE